MSTRSDDDLLTRWEAAKKTGIKKRMFAKEIGIGFKSLDNKLYRASKRRKNKGIDNVDDIVDGNYRYLLSNTSRIKTLDDLIKACNVDLNEWQVDDDYEIGSWEMGRRGEEKKIKWENGKIESGYTEDTGKLWIETLYRIRATLVRKKPKPIQPLISLVSFSLDKIKPDIDRHVSGKILVVPDSQTGYRRDFKTGKLIPFHDRLAHDIVMQVAEYDSFDAVTYLGDGVDFSEWSDKFVAEPEFYYTTQPAIIEYAWFLSQMKAILPNADHDMILGNHEDRVNSQLRKHLYAACNLKPATEIELDQPYSIRRLLGLDSIGISISDKYPNGEVWHGKHVRCVHSCGLVSNPGGTAQKMIRDITETTVAGHNHRLEMAIKTIDDRDGIRYITAATCGCLCHIDYRVPGHNKGQHWQQGFAVINYDSKSPVVELIPIYNGQAVYHGKKFIGRDYAGIVQKDTGWQF